jgi:hypothetical protein
MDSVKRNEIEERLRKLMEDEMKKEGPAKHAGPQAPCNVIRRRKGEADKRIYALQ